MSVKCNGVEDGDGCSLVNDGDGVVEIEVEDGETLVKLGDKVASSFASNEELNSRVLREDGDGGSSLTSFNIFIASFSISCW